MYAAEHTENGTPDLAKENSETPDRSMFRRSRKKNEKKKVLIITLCCILGAALITGAVFLAIWIFGGNSYDRTSEFYFTSDILTEDGGNFASSGDIRFTLYNYADALRTNIYNIETFDVTVKSGGKDITSKCTVQKSAESMPKNVRSSVSVTVSLPENYDGTPVDVYVKSKPTEIVLRGTFTVVPEWSYSLESEEGSIVATLVLSCNDGGEFEVEWDKDKVSADNNDPAVASADGNKCTIVLSEEGSYELRFFKNDVDESYSGSGDDIPVSVRFSDGGDEK